jgi:hypothetical protein
MEQNQSALGSKVQRDSKGKEGCNERRKGRRPELGDRRDCRLSAKSGLVSTYTWLDIPSRKTDQLCLKKSN